MPEMPRLSASARNNLESESAVIGQVSVREERAADADVDTTRPVEQALFRRSAERRAVRDRGAEVGVPGVQVRVEVHDRDRAMDRGERAQQRQRDRVIAAQSQQVRHAIEQSARHALDGRDGLIMLNGLTAMSSASTTWSLANGDTSSAGLYGLSNREDSLMWMG
jgi:hypothetical protein